MDIDEHHIFDLMVMMVVEMNLIHNCEVMVVAQVAGLDVYPIKPFMVTSFITPGLFNMGVLPLSSQSLMAMMVDSAKVIVEGGINNYDFVTHFQKINYSYLF